MLTANSVLMFQLFYNLILNSLKFSKADICCQREITCEQVVVKEKIFHNIVLWDHGIGFDPKFEKSIFATVIHLNSKDDY